MHPTEIAEDKLHLGDRDHLETVAAEAGQVLQLLRRYGRQRLRPEIPAKLIQGLAEALLIQGFEQIVEGMVIEALTANSS